MTQNPREKILPFFLPMYGCPRRCIFCDQNAISGRWQGPSYQRTAAEIAAYEGDGTGEIAFYGGSFTCLPLEMQEAYLREAAKGVSAGKFRGVRISTRPDAVDDAVCEFLKRWNVTTIELGVQSLDDEVLRRAGRGYDGAAAEAGCKTAAAHGFRLGVQLMTGLPGDTWKKDIQSLLGCVKYGPELLRIYPTLVLRGTPLAELWQKGEYEPQTLEDAVAVCRDMLSICLWEKITVQRMGINPSPDVEAALLAGPYHPAFGGMVRESLKKAQIWELLQGLSGDLPAILRFPKNELPLVFGQNRQTMLELGRKWPGLALAPDADLEPGTLSLQWENHEKRSLERSFCLEYQEKIKKTAL